MSEHTPGPWKWDAGDAGHDSSAPYCDVYVDGGDLIIARVNDKFDKAIGHANARLIAAAPDHALIARAMCVACGRWEPWGPWGDGRGEFCMNGLRYATRLDAFGVPEVTPGMRTAIAKATGAPT